MIRLRVVVTLCFCLTAYAESGFKSLSELPAELWTEPRSESTGTVLLSESKDFPEARIESAGQGLARVRMRGAKTLRMETLPALPYYEQEIAASGTGDLDVAWEDIHAVQSEGEVPLRLAAETQFWTQDPRFTFEAPVSTRYFPGHLVEAKRQVGKVRIRFFPVQWDRVSRRLILLRGFRFTVKQKPSEPVQRIRAPKNTSLIIVPEALVEGARELQKFHAKRYSIGSDIVTLEAIARDEQPIAESELPPGYKDGVTRDDFVKPFVPATGEGYDYKLARQIAQHIQSQLHAGGLKYVTLLGNGALIPPSYYFSVRQGFGTNFGVTDQCYAAVKQCMEPRAAVGRLPFSSLDEIRNHLAKVDRWLNQSPAASSELSLYGGKAFDGPFYIGELGVLRALPSNATWRGVKKYFRTSDNYDAAAVLDMVQGNRDSSLVYSLDHGSGNTWHVEGEGVTSIEIAAASSAGPQVNPLVFSIACTNAAFDEATAKESLFNDDQAGTESVGVALLKSKAGAVGYFGSGRPAMGAPSFEIDEKGNLDLMGSDHGLRLLDQALETYQHNPGKRLGDYVQGSLAAYAVDPASPLTGDRFKWSYFNAVLLADPTMPMPQRARTETALPLSRALDVIEPDFSGYFPLMELAGQDAFALGIESFTDANAMLFSQKRVFGQVTENLVATQKLKRGIDQLVYQNPKEGTYFMRIENSEGVPVERQLYFSVTQ